MSLRRILAVIVVAAVGVALPAAQERSSKTLDIYVVDVEGGNATLFVSPSGESVLIDTGNGGAAAHRDAERIMAAVKDAGLTQIDHLITTHWHGDHYGGDGGARRRIPIRAVHRSRRQRAARGRAPTNSCRRSIPRSTRRERTPSRSRATRSRSRVSTGGSSRRRARRSRPAAGRGQAESVLRHVTSRRTAIRPRTRSRSAASSRSAGSGSRTSAT